MILIEREVSYIAVVCIGLLVSLLPIARSGYAQFLITGWYPLFLFQPIPKVRHFTVSSNMGFLLINVIYLLWGMLWGRIVGYSLLQALLLGISISFVHLVKIGIVRGATALLKQGKIGKTWIFRSMFYDMNSLIPQCIFLLSLQWFAPGQYQNTVTLFLLASLYLFIRVRPIIGIAKGSPLWYGYFFVYLCAFEFLPVYLLFVNTPFYH